MILLRRFGCQIQQHRKPHVLAMHSQIVQYRSLQLYFQSSIENFFAYAILRAALFSAASPAERLRRNSTFSNGWTFHRRQLFFLLLYLD